MNDRTIASYVRSGNPEPAVSAGTRLVVDENGNGTWVDDPVAVPAEAGGWLAVPEDRSFVLRGQPDLLVVSNHKMGPRELATIRRCVESLDMDVKAVVLEEVSALYQLVDGRWQPLEVYGRSPLARAFCDGQGNA
jgi:hypothetical protein